MLYLKVFHIIGVVVWFSGLFYIGRLFVYHQEANQMPENEKTVLKAQFALMERRLWYAITWPGFWVTLGMGLALLHLWGFPGWIHIKLILVLLLVIYHLVCGMLRKQLLEDGCRLTSTQLRMFNEIPTLLLVAIVFVVVFKDAFSWINLGFLIGGLALLIVGVILLRKTLLPKKKDS